MTGRIQKIFIGILLLVASVALIFYGMGYGTSMFGMPIYKLLIGAAIVAWIIAKIFFGKSLRERFRIFFPLALLFMLLEKEIAVWCELPNDDFLNNWLVLFSALLATVAINFIIPKKKRADRFFKFRKTDRLYNGFESVDNNSLSTNTVFIDAEQIKKSYVKNRLGETTVYYQNTYNLSSDEEFLLDISNSMGETIVHVPADWMVTNKVRNSLGDVSVRESNGNGAKLTVTGNNLMGDTQIVSP